ncbi:PREDICTED: cytochrome c oxidase subunit 6a, mitochondrial-like isoform X2 [Ipomoea nil]|uniref:cytochrome c oxidase subunit 6a, mitochondrial-like isoform X2 n=1 Tax=Ipomoea nil TaxID=35883 RepID=UPI000901EA97|nr:PREDICTED: cytochrome c oxidase subunit 6a, mitochondrial-like isoform X2 [Ipomoea nil]
MASTIVRSSIRSALRGGVSRRAPASKRSFSSSAHHDEAAEASKWEKITYAGIVACTILAAVNLSKGHPHFEEPPAYPYMHIRNKEFPWGPDGLFEVKHH